MFKSTLLIDFEKFKTEPSVDTRVALSGRICSQFNNFPFTKNEREIVNDILSFLSMDIESKIRHMIADSLKENKDIPRFLARRLAYDITEVSSPILEFCEILTDEDLKDIIQTTSEVAKLVSIANRKNISENISFALVDKAMDEVASALINNAGAEINDHCKEHIFDMFKTSENVLALLVQRGGLSVNLASRMIVHVSDKIAAEITRNYGVNVEIAKKVTTGAEDTLNIEIVSGDETKSKTRELVRHLHRNNKLNHSIILRALCSGNIEFFYYGLTLLSGINYQDTVLLIEKGHEKALESLFKASSMPTTMYKASYILLGIICNIPEEKRNTIEYYNGIIRQIKEKDYDKTISNMRYFIALIGSLRDSITD